MGFLEEDEFIGIRRITEEDKDTYYNMAKARSFMRALYDDIFVTLWNGFMTGTVIMFTAFEKENNSICGFCQLDMECPSEPEIGIDMLDGYMNQGLGTRIASAVIRYASSLESVEHFIWKADTENIKSRKIAERLEGELIQERKLLPDSIINYGLEKGLLQEEDLTTVCKYKIPKMKGRNIKFQ